MGQFRDWCLATGETESEWRARDNKVARSSLKGTDIKLPAPYHRRTGELEAPILKALLAALTTAGVWHTRIENSGKVIHTKQGMRMIPSAQTGLPDVLACHKGRMVAIECKCSGGSLSASQHSRLLDMNHAGALVCVCVSPEKTLQWLLNGSDATATLPSGIQIL